MKEQLYIFVDLDGVFQEPKTYKKYSDSLALFNKMVKALNAKVVISSDWRLLKDISYFNNMFCNQVDGMNSELNGLSEHDRYHECILYTNTHGISNFIILDDKQDLFPKKKKVFITDPSQGFNEQTKEDICNYLKTY